MSVKNNKLRLLAGILTLVPIFTLSCSTPPNIPQTNVNPTTVASAKVVLSDNLTPN
jgi:hypothetical protein